ncbi:ankyrin repeat [Fusarium beomiforme]|uniref:Ankyrin repeat n=1 Tax=Fusarium beomiforme TaxID=44412 RepID=A0A9P5AN48_9HYPO|nr:ankyrin repeat [Fusarium beomiforme]
MQRLHLLWKSKATKTTEQGGPEFYGTRAYRPLAITPDHNPLEPRELPLRPEGKTFSHLDYDLVRPFETHVKSICGNFVRVVHRKIYLVHETAREFLLEHKSPADEQIGRSLSTKKSEDPFTACYYSFFGPQPSLNRNGRLKQDPGPWQHSFSLEICDAILLHICTPFLYMMGKKCSNALLGYPSDSSRSFLKYAGRFWPDHLRNIRDRIAPQHIAYYANLCHPNFPGFRSWTAALHGQGQASQLALGRSADELQDHYVRMLGIGHPSCSSADFDISDEDSDSDRGKEFSRKDHGRKYKEWYAKKHKFQQQTIGLSSNPGSLSNHYFPVVADENGFVSLDFPEGNLSRPK